MGKSNSAALSMISAAAKRPEPVRAVTQSASSERAPSREGKYNVSAWLPVEFKKGIRHVQSIRADLTMQDVLAEALNDLFSKYNLPTVSEPTRPLSRQERKTERTPS